MTVFKPVGDSIRVRLSGGEPVNVEMPTVPSGGAVQLFYTHTMTLYAKFGDALTTVTTEDGMPLDFSQKSLLIGVEDTATHIALIADGGTAVVVTVTAGALLA